MRKSSRVTGSPNGIRAAPGEVATQIAQKDRHRQPARYQAARSAMYDFTAATSGGSTA